MFGWEDAVPPPVPVRADSIAAPSDVTIPGAPSPVFGLLKQWGPDLLRLGASLFRPADPVERLAKLKAERELAELLGDVHGAGVQPATLDAVAMLLPALTIIVGGQHCGKTTLQGAVADARFRCEKRARRCLWAEPTLGVKASARPPWAEPVTGPLVERGADLYLDDAWEWLEASPGSKRAKHEWMRRLFHEDMRVVCSVQSGRFLSPDVWRAGSCGIIHVGGSEIGDRFEREEVAELLGALSYLATPCKKAALYLNGTRYVFDYGPACYDELAPGDVDLGPEGETNA